MTQQQQDNNGPQGQPGPSSSGEGNNASTHNSLPPRGGGGFNEPPRNTPAAFSPRDAPVALHGNGGGRVLPGPSSSGEGNNASTNNGLPLRGGGGFNEPPRNTPAAFPPRDAPVALQGTGRGRGRTLPAWMTQQQSNDGPKG
jgi:hypothetical protein